MSPIESSIHVPFYKDNEQETDYSTTTIKFVNLQLLNQTHEVQVNQLLCQCSFQIDELQEEMTKFNEKLQMIKNKQEKLFNALLLDSQKEKKFEKEKYETIYS